MGERGWEGVIELGVGERGRRERDIGGVRVGAGARSGEVGRRRGGTLVVRAAVRLFCS